jgi:glycosyltransferase involved in cell wall biosynthesis
VRLPFFSTPVAKKPIILSVGRFFKAKRQDALIRAFERLQPDIGKEWQLVLAGGRSSNGDPYYRQLEEMIEKNPRVVLRGNLDEVELQQLYRAATLYWHGMGFERAAATPEMAEHFGMSTIEAMHCGAVPVVFRDGGQVEIVTEDVGRTWTTLDQLVAHSRELIGDSTLWQRYSEASVAAAKQYGLETFQVKVAEIAKKLR